MYHILLQVACSYAICMCNCLLTEPVLNMDGDMAVAGAIMAMEPDVAPGLAPPPGLANIDVGVGVGKLELSHRPPQGHALTRLHH